MFRHYPGFKVFLCGNVEHFAQKFCKFSGMFRFFKSNPFISFSNFRETFPVRLAAHCQIHAYFRAFALEIQAQAFQYFRVRAFGGADAVPRNESKR